MKFQQILAARWTEIKPRDGVVAETRFEYEGVVAGSSVHDVIAEPTGDCVVPTFAVERVISGTTKHDIIVAPGVDDVVSIEPIDDIGTSIHVDGVIALTADDVFDGV